MQIFKATENGINDNGETIYIFNDGSMVGQKYYELVKSGKVTIRLYPCVKSSQFVYYEDVAENNTPAGYLINEHNKDMHKIDKCRLILANKARNYFTIGNYFSDTLDPVVISMAMDCKRRASSLPSIVGPLYNVAAKTDVVPGLKVLSEKSQATIERMRNSQMFLANQVKSVSVSFKLKKGAAFKPFEKVNCDHVIKKVRAKKGAPTDMTSFYQSKSEWHKKTKSPYTHNDELLSLALSDSIIKILESGEVYKKSLFPDSCIGVDFVHVSDNVGYCRKTFSHCITNLSEKWDRKKRPQQENGFSHVYADGKEIDAFSLLADNYSDDSSFHKSAMKLLKGDMATIYELKMFGFSGAEIAVKMEKSERTIDSLWSKVKISLKTIASDLADEIRRQNELPSYAW